MIWAAILHSSIWLGYEIVGALAPDVWDVFDLFAAGCPTGIALSNWFFYFYRRIHELDQTTGILFSIFMYISAFIIHQKLGIKRRIRKLRITLICIFAMIMAMIMILLDVSFLKKGIISSGTTYSDLAVHMSLITSFSYGANSGTDKLITPFYAGTELRYPIVPDFFSSVLVSCGGASIRLSIVLPSLTIFVSVLISLISLFKLFASREYGVELSLFFFFFAGGVGWKWMLIPKCLRNYNANAIHSFCVEETTFWIHPLVHFMLPQRSGLFSFSLVIYIILLLNHMINSKMRDFRFPFLSGVMMGLIPMISAHAFIAAGEYAIFLCLLNFPFANRSKWNHQIVFWGIFGVTSIIIAAPQVYSLIGGNHRQMMSFEFIWKETEHSYSIGSFFRMWWNSLGSLVFVSMTVSWFFFNKAQKSLYLPSAMVWIVSNCILYQPGAMDNTKVFLCAWYPLACCAFANVLLSILATPRAKAVITLPLVLIIVLGTVASSFFCIGKAIVMTTTIFNNQELEFGYWIRAFTPKNAVFLTPQWHSNTAMTIAGRTLVMGYGGWVWSHGLDYFGRLDYIKKLIENRENKTAFEPHRITYALRNDREKDTQFPEIESGSIWMKVLQSGHLHLYKMIQ